MSKIMKAALIVMLGTVLSKVFGFLRDIVLASTYGTSIYTDAYLVALIIPSIIFGAIGSALGTAFIPVYCEIQEKKGSRGTRNFTNNALNIVVLICIVISGLGIVFADKLTCMLAPGFSGEALELATVFSRIMLPGIIFVGLNYLFTSYLQTNNNFTVPAVMGIPFNILVILSITLSAKGNVYLLAYGMLLALIAQFLFQLFYALKLGFRYEFSLDFSSDYLKKLGVFLIPIFVGVSALQFSFLIDRVFASSLVEGSISALNFAGRLNEFVFGVFTLSIAAVIYPLASKIAARGEQLKVQEQTFNAVNVVMLMLFPITVFFLVLDEPIVRFIFERGSFDNHASRLTATALFCYAPGIIGFGIRDVLLRTYYALLDTKTPMVNGLIVLALNAFLNFVFIGRMGHGGLALATSISVLLGTIVLFYKLPWDMGSPAARGIVLTAVKAAAASGVMGLLIKLLHNHINQAMMVEGFIGNLLVLLGLMSLGLLVYILLAVLLKVKEMGLLVEMLKKAFVNK